jgi:hypothetical protein
VPESSVDKRVGHVVGSDVTREYTRLSDSDSNRAYARGYGQEQSEEELEDDLMPLKCSECQIINPGYRDRCYGCKQILEIQEIQEIQNKEVKAKELIWKTLEERGLTDEVLENL